MFVIMVVAWIAAWTFIGLRVCGFRIPWKSAAAAAAVIFVFAAASSMLSWQTAERRVAVVVQVPATGVNTDALTARLSQGQIVEPIQTRGGTIRVRTESGETVWLPSDLVEVI
jgi:hypothetical protein